MALAPKLASKLCRCIKKVRKTVKVRKGSTGGKESAAIGICVRSVIQRKEQRRTLKRFSCRTTPRLITQKSIQYN